MNAEQKNNLFTEMVELLELPDSAYEKAKSRYEDIGAWFLRDESKCKVNDPHIFPQGSFRLGTVIRPLGDKEAYDLDLACKLIKGIEKKSHTQQHLKELVGGEVETYRQARKIEAPKGKKPRCWRLDYQDELSFHIDIVPCIPEEETRKQRLFESMKRAGLNEAIAGDISKLTVSITDENHPGYLKICDDWFISNQEGYALWFQARMRQTKEMVFAEAKVDDLPLYKRKSTLQRSIQLLKRHRDLMYKGKEDFKPISAIITTLAARTYQGESELFISLENILSHMGEYVNSNKPRVPNPVDPNEDFADKWDSEKGKRFRLEDNFWHWLEQANVDFTLVGSRAEPAFIAQQSLEKFQVKLDVGSLKKRFGLSDTIIPVSPKITHIKETERAKPWTMC